ncbi:hypothetical protein EZV62_017161 [Acer yangbiense]|uniref:NAD-dependent epimerase/dehydratase domain-containing protein n=1 Tax=Acer yangbiense TaxID=1000413 RepID=A0A5C7HGF3_9ROSI|nr:hypothetical protein EZV62_017161 [Acer yangbiense]
MSGEGKVVCVTGASGYIVASWLVKLLLEHGYTVKATVGDPNDPKKTQHLLALDAAEERLHTFKASLSEEGSFDSAIDGCDGVFHTASPVVFSTNDPQVDIVDAAVNGTLNVLKSCAKVPSVKRVVFTSSMAAVMHWKTSHPAYYATWKFAQENGIDLVAINPGLVIGPLLQPTLNLSVEIVLKLIVNGDRTFPSPYRFVDTRNTLKKYFCAFGTGLMTASHMRQHIRIHFWEKHRMNLKWKLTSDVGIGKESIDMIVDGVWKPVDIDEASIRGHSLKCKFNFSILVYLVEGDAPPHFALKDMQLCFETSCRVAYPSAQNEEHPPSISKDDPKKTEHLLALDGAKERLQIFQASLLEEGSFDSAIDGCDGVFHTASPVLLFSDVSKADVVDPALKGTLNVLRSCAKVPSIRRVILTSSTAAVLLNGKPLTPNVTVDETWFSDPAFCEKSKLWYVLGKTLVEEADWKFSLENRINMVAINPGVVTGPLLQPTLNDSVKPILNLIKGVPCGTNGWVDVRDVAKAHIQAFENPTACGRYCLVKRVMDYFGIFKILRGLYPDLNPPEEYSEEKASEPTYRVSKERVQSLDITYIPFEEYFMAYIL